MDEVRDLDGRLCGRRALAGTRDSLRELRGLAEPLVVREHPDVQAHEIGYAATACSPLARPSDETNEQSSALGTVTSCGSIDRMLLDHA